MNATFLFVGFLVIVAWCMVCLWRIAVKAGYSGWWSLITVIPVLGVLLIWIFPFLNWPRGPRNLPIGLSQEPPLRGIGDTFHGDPETSDGTFDEGPIYDAIAGELDGDIADKGLWTRIFAECEGDEKQAKVLYIKRRAACLISAERLRLEQMAQKRSPCG